MWPPANTLTLKAAPLARGPMTPAPAPIPVQPIVRTRKKVPMNSAMYLFIVYLFSQTSLEKSRRINNWTLVLSLLMAVFSLVIKLEPYTPWAEDNAGGSNGKSGPCRLFETPRCPLESYSNQDDTNWSTGNANALQSRLRTIA